jgi:hypothetical protein
MRWTALLISLLLAAPAAASPMGSTVAGFAPGAVGMELTFDYGGRGLDAALLTDEEREDQLEGRARVLSGGMSLALTVEPIRYVAFEGRFFGHQPRIEALGYEGPFGWGCGGMVRVTPIHAAGDLVHAGVYGSFDAQMVGWPSAPYAPVHLYNLRAGVGVGFGGARHGWYIDLGAHYSRLWGQLTMTIEDKYDVVNADGDTVLETETWRAIYDPSLALPVGARIGMGFFSAPIAPATNTRSRVTAGLDVRLIDEWGASVRMGVIF